MQLPAHADFQLTGITIRASCYLAMQAALYLAVGQVAPSPTTFSYPKIFAYETIAEYPHDAGAFTQGLEYEKACMPTAGGEQNCTDAFWESTGMPYG